MPKLPQVRPKKLVKLLKKEGFVERKTKSGHIFFYHEDGRTTTVAIHNKPLAKGTLRGILRQIEMSVEELVEKL